MLQSRGIASGEGRCTGTYVTTEQFLVAFDLETLHDLPDREQLEVAGMIGADPEASDEADRAPAG